MKTIGFGKGAAFRGDIPKAFNAPLPQQSHKAYQNQVDEQYGKEAFLKTFSTHPYSDKESIIQKYHILIHDLPLKKIILFSKHNISDSTANTIPLEKLEVLIDLIIQQTILLKHRKPISILIANDWLNGFTYCTNFGLRRTPLASDLTLIKADSIII